MIPIPEQSTVQMLCSLLECLLTTEAVPADCPRETYELYFVFAAIWAFGGAMAQDQVRRYAKANTHVQVRRGKSQRSTQTTGQPNVRINRKASSHFVIYTSLC